MKFNVAEIRSQLRLIAPSIYQIYYENMSDQDLVTEILRQKIVLETLKKKAGDGKPRPAPATIPTVNGD
jgi:hypothetical protein